MSKQIAVIGVGSDFGEDNIAERIILQLQESALLDLIHIAYYNRPGMYLLEIMKPFSTVILIDAVVSGQAIGTLHSFDTLDWLSLSPKKLSSHAMGISDVISLGQVLDVLPAKIYFYGIEIPLGICCSENVIKLQAAQAQLLDRVHKTLAEEIEPTNTTS